MRKLLIAAVCGSLLGASTGATQAVAESMNWCLFSGGGEVHNGCGRTINISWYSTDVNHHCYSRNGRYQCSDTIAAGNRKKISSGNGSAYWGSCPYPSIPTSTGHSSFECR
jgi:hypothetical protein